MIISTLKIPDIKPYNTYIHQITIDGYITVIIIFKTLFRSDDVLVDIYLNEIADNTKIISGRKLTKDSIISLPKFDIGFPFQISCIDQDCVGFSINKYNADKYYINFSNNTDGDIIVDNNLFLT